jgi:hypothetical protein
MDQPLYWADRGNNNREPESLAEIASFYKPESTSSYSLCCNVNNCCYVIEESMKEDVLMAAFTALESAHFYSAFLPSIFTIGTFVQEADGVSLIRKGEAIATASAVGLASVVSALTKSRLPLYFTIFTSLLMLMVYESALNNV